MNQYNNPFKHEIIRLDESVELHILEIEEINGEFRKFLDDNIVNIMYGMRKIDKETAKNVLEKFLSSKDNNIQHGAIAEFFTHLYLSTQDYKQECLFRNLEEKSIKKGFDGYYSKDCNEWIMESKSTSKQDIYHQHKEKINEAYRDLKNKLAGKNEKNPWDNAYNHANLKDVNTNQSIIDNINKLSLDFNKGIYKNIQDFNIIYSGTIFLKGDWHNDKEHIQDSIKKILDKIKCQQTQIICITQKTKELFLTYLEQGD